MLESDLVIVGGGPAGITAGIYSARASLKVFIFDEKFGGQLNNTDLVENYPGFNRITGFSLANRFKKNIFKLKKYITCFQEYVIKIEKEHPFFIVITNYRTVKTKSVILATGSISKPLLIDNKIINLPGISYCYICDGFLFKNKNVMVIGGGDSSLEASLYLAELVKKVNLVCKYDNFKYDSDKIILQKVLKHKKIDIFFNTNISKIENEKKDNKFEITLYNNKTDFKLSVDGIFPCLGLIPNLNFDINLKDNKLLLSNKGFIIVNNNFSTSEEGIFAAGDITEISDIGIVKTESNQIVNATSSGSIAAGSVISYLKNKF